jgi:hypothetical protein
MKLVCALVCAIGTAACSSATAPSGPLDRQVAIPAGQTASVADAGVSIRFDGVLGDSRCPADAICIQGGDAIVRLDVDGLGRRATHELHTGDSRIVARHEDLTIALVQLEPYPFGSRPPIQPGDYRVTLRLTR